MDETSVLLVQSGLRREKLLIQMQSISAVVQVLLTSATIIIPNDTQAEPMTPSTKDMGVGPTFWTLQSWALLIRCLFITTLFNVRSIATLEQGIRKMRKMSESQNSCQTNVEQEF